MKNKSEAVKLWRKNTKEKIVKSFGGKCGICGYDKCNEALDVHHLDPDTKKFSLAGSLANPKKWIDLVTELKKCVLLCRNCHAEHHYSDLKIPENIKRFDDSMINVKFDNSDYSIMDKCPVCLKEKSTLNITCSKQCARKRVNSYDWSKFDFKDMFIEKKMSKRKISNIIGCSHASVVKQLKKLGLI